mgnify:CR=1 FL=1
MPVAFDPGGLHAVGYSNAFPGGYGELMLLSDLVAMKVPNGLDHQLDTLIRPSLRQLHRRRRLFPIPQYLFDRLRACRSWFA